MYSVSFERSKDSICVFSMPCSCNMCVCVCVCVCMCNSHSLTVKTVCKKCIKKKITKEKLDKCPICSKDLGCAPLEKLRYLLFLASVLQHFSIVNQTDCLKYMRLVDMCARWALYFTLYREMHVRFKSFERSTLVFHMNRKVCAQYSWSIVLYTNPNSQCRNRRWINYRSVLYCSSSILVSIKTHLIECFDIIYIPFFHLLLSQTMWWHAWPLHFHLFFFLKWNEAFQVVEVDEMLDLWVWFYVFMCKIWLTFCSVVVCPCTWHNVYISVESLVVCYASKVLGSLGL